MQTINKHHSISYRLLIYVLICSSAFTLLTTLFQLYFDYRKDISDVDKNFKFIEQTILSAIILNVYTLDMDQLKLQIEGILNIKNVTYVNLADKQGVIYQSGNQDAPRDIIKTYPLNYENNFNKKYFVGTLTVVISLDDIYAGIIKKFLVILISNGIKMFLASFVILMIIQKVITRHIQKMAEYTRNIVPDILSDPLEIARTKPRHRDELEDLVQAINHLKDRSYSDIIQRSKAEQALRNSVTQFKTLSESSEDVIMRFDKNFRHLYVNPAILKTTNIAPEKFIGKTFRELDFSNHLIEKWEAIIQLTFQSKKPHRLEFQLDNGTWLDWSLCPEISSTGEVDAVITSARDITARKKYEVELQELRSFSENIINYMPSILIGIDQDNKVTHWNKEAETITNVRQLFALSKDINKLIPSIKPYLDAFSKSKNTQKQWRQDKIILFDDPKRYFDVTIYPLYLKNHDTAVVRLDDVTERVKMEYEIKQLNLDLEDRVELRTKELQESMQKLKQTQKHLVQNEKMAALGGLVAGISHEINTPLGLGVTESTYLKDKAEECYVVYQKDELTQSYFEEFLKTTINSTSSIFRNLERTGKLISSFKQVAVDQVSEELRDFYVQSYIDEIILSLTPKLKKTEHEIIITCPKSLKIRSYPGVVSQIFTNFVMNSILHGLNDVNKGLITLDISTVENNIKMVYRDNGIGMTEESVKKIFDPFFTTSRGQGGTGLGMHIVFNLVSHTLNGSISCSSSPNKGVEFVVKFPVEILTD